MGGGGGLGVPRVGTRDPCHWLGGPYTRKLFCRTYLGIRSRGGGGGSPKGLVHNVVMQFFTQGSSKIEVFETGLFDIVTT